MLGLVILIVACIVATIATTIDNVETVILVPPLEGSTRGKCLVNGQYYANCQALDQLDSQWKGNTLEITYGSPDVPGSGYMTILMYKTDEDSFIDSKIMIALGDIGYVFYLINA